MQNVKRIVLLCVILLHVAVVLATEQTEKTVQKTELETGALGAISRFLGYLKRDGKFLNMPIDTAYQLTGVVENVRHKYRKIARSAQHLINADMREQQTRFPGEYSKFSRLVQRKFVTPWNKFSTMRGLPRPQKRGTSDAMRFSEKASDVCVVQALNCEIGPQSCFDMQLNTNTSSYTATHQILYFFFLYKQCPKQLAAQPVKARLLVKALAQIAANVIDEQYHDSKIASDLWAERIVVTSLLGYQKVVLTDNAVRAIIDSQTTSGCWAPIDRNIHKRDATIDDDDGTQNEQDHFSTLLDTNSGDSCSYHLSGMMAWVLSMYLNQQ